MANSIPHSARIIKSVAAAAGPIERKNSMTGMPVPRTTTATDTGAITAALADHTIVAVTRSLWAVARLALHARTVARAAIPRRAVCRPVVRNSGPASVAQVVSIVANAIIWTTGTAGSHFVSNARGTRSGATQAIPASTGKAAAATIAVVWAKADPSKSPRRFTSEK